MTEPRKATVERVTQLVAVSDDKLGRVYTLQAIYDWSAACLAAGADMQTPIWIESGLSFKVEQ